MNQNQDQGIDIYNATEEQIEQEMITVANQTLKNLNIEYVIMKAQALYGDRFYLAVFAQIFRNIDFNQIEPSDTQEGQAQNIQALIDILENYVLDINLQGVKGTEIVKGNHHQILELLVLIQQISELVNRELEDEDEQQDENQNEEKYKQKQSSAPQSGKQIGSDNKRRQGGGGDRPEPKNFIFPDAASSAQARQQEQNTEELQQLRRQMLLNDQQLKEQYENNEDYMHDHENQISGNEDMMNLPNIQNDQSSKHHLQAQQQQQEIPNQEEGKEHLKFYEEYGEKLKQRGFDQPSSYQQQLFEQQRLMRKSAGDKYNEFEGDALHSMLRDDKVPQQQELLANPDGTAGGTMGAASSSDRAQMRYQRPSNVPRQLKHPGQMAGQGQNLTDTLNSSQPVTTQHLEDLLDGVHASSNEQEKYQVEQNIQQQPDLRERVFTHKQEIRKNSGGGGGDKRIQYKKQNQNTAPGQMHFYQQQHHHLQKQQKLLPQSYQFRNNFHDMSDQDQTTQLPKYSQSGLQQSRGPKNQQQQQQQSHQYDFYHGGEGDRNMLMPGEQLDMDMDMMDAADIQIQNPGQQQYDVEEDQTGQVFDNGRRLSHSKSNKNLIDNGSSQNNSPGQQQYRGMQDEMESESREYERIRSQQEQLKALHEQQQQQIGENISPIMRAEDEEELDDGQKYIQQEYIPQRHAAPTNIGPKKRPSTAKRSNRSSAKSKKSSKQQKKITTQSSKRYDQQQYGDESQSSEHPQWKQNQQYQVLKDRTRSYQSIYNILTDNLLKAKSKMQSISQVVFPQDDQEIKQKIARDQAKIQMMRRDKMKQIKIKSQKYMKQIKLNQQTIRRQQKMQTIQEKSLEEKLRNQQKSQMLKRNAQQVRMCHRIYKKASQLQKDRLIQEKKDYLAYRRVQNQQKRIIFQGIRNAYVDKITQMKEKVEVERIERKIAQQARNQALKQMEKQLRSHKNKEIQDYLNLLRQEDQRYDFENNNLEKFEEKLMQIYKKR